MNKLQEIQVSSTNDGVNNVFDFEQHTLEINVRLLHHMMHGSTALILSQLDNCYQDCSLLQASLLCQSFTREASRKFFIGTFTNIIRDVKYFSFTNFQLSFVPKNSNLILKSSKPSLLAKSSRKLLSWLWQLVLKTSYQ